MKSLPSSEILQVVKDKGMLAKQLYLVTTVPTDDLTAIMPVLEDHLAYQVSLEARGDLFAAGPNWTVDGAEWTGEGTVVLRADSLEHATQLMEADPMHSSGARSFSIKPWLVNEGKLTVELSMSVGRFALT